MRSQFPEIPWGSWLLQLKIQQWGRELLILALKWMQKMKIRSQFLEIPWGSWLLQLNILQWGRELIIWTLKWMQKTQNEEPVSGNSLGELAPPPKYSTVGERIYNLDSEVDAEN